MKKVLFNTASKEELKQKLANETFRRVTLSFYRYVIIENPEAFRDWLYEAFDSLGVLGRTYIANEGINSQISVPEYNFEALRALVDSHSYLNNVPFKIAVEDDGKSFYKLIVRLREKVVADGLQDETFDVTNVGKHLTAKEFNAAMEQPETIVIDLRNHYESEIGHFQNAILPDTDTFRETLPVAIDQVKDKKEKKILLYCTGGIRCEKASAYFRHVGFTDVNQLHGGIIDYYRQIKAEGLPSKFIGKNFVFDDRLGERISNDIISKCHQCGAPSDHHTNCANDDCHLLFIQCEDCAAKNEGCCSKTCIDFIHLPFEQQVKLRRGLPKHDAHSVYRKSRVRPRLNEMTLHQS
ncbi:MAG: rhodanese-related sulfurtransferase [Bacteroidetes bacterium]|nr:rhodanese-related sulfurtransferase [Bacteroidota bacterium]MBK8414637.1 rhodanese-related sulfurtransferase [Bacteroidota bacterium]